MRKDMVNRTLRICRDNGRSATHTGISPEFAPETIAMTYSTRNTGDGWTAADIAELRRLVRENTPTRVIAFKLGRTEAAVYAKASELGISLTPVNQSPYNRRKDS
jgi:hypothetical protein